MRRARSKGQTFLLNGILINMQGTPFIPNHANKKGKRYRYYVEQTLPEGINRKRHRIPAPQIEAAVRQSIDSLLQYSARLVDMLGLSSAEDIAQVMAGATNLSRRLAAASDTEWAEVISALEHVICDTDRLIIRFNASALKTLLELPTPIHDNASDRDTCEFTAPVSIRLRGNEMKLILPPANTGTIAYTPDAALIRAVARAHSWFHQLRTGEVRSVGDIARTEGFTTSFVSRTLRLAFLAPDLIQQIIDATQPPHLTTDYLMIPGNIPMNWDQQGGVRKGNEGKI